MCELCHSKLNRRHLAGLFGVAAVVGALPGLTHRAKAATAGAVEALVVTCMDYRIDRKSTRLNSSH